LRVGRHWAQLSAALCASVALPALCQPVWQTSATAVGTGNATVARPAGTASGHLLVLGLMVEKGSGETITAPAGWNLIRRSDQSTNAGMATYRRSSRRCRKWSDFESSVE
jgi:hypothetical protein